MCTLKKKNPKPPKLEKKIRFVVNSAWGFGQWVAGELEKGGQEQQLSALDNTLLMILRI